jgi:hypothetical protein
MCRVGGDDKRRLPRMARGKVQRQRAGDSRLPHAAFSYDKCELGH